jgi:hypothetical protein
MGRRKAQVWKQQQEMTNLDGNITDKAVLQEKLRIKIALQIMRKAYVDGSSADRTRIKLKKLAEGELDAFDEKKKVTKTKKKASDQYQEFPAFHVKSLGDLMKDAKESYLIKKDKQKLENESKRYGQLRPVCSSLIEELKNEKRTERDNNTTADGGKKPRPQSAPTRPHSLVSALRERKLSNLKASSDSLEGESVYSESQVKITEETVGIAEERDGGNNTTNSNYDWRAHIVQTQQTMLFQRPSPLTLCHPDETNSSNNNHNQMNNNSDQHEQNHFQMRRNRETFIIPQSHRQSSTEGVQGLLRMRPQSAGILRSSISSAISAIDDPNAMIDNWMNEMNTNTNTNNNNNTNGKIRPSTAGGYRREGSQKSLLRSSFGTAGGGGEGFAWDPIMTRTVSFDPNNTTGGGRTHSRPTSPNHRGGAGGGSDNINSSSDAIKPRTPSVIMRTSTLDEDENILRAMKKKEEQLQEKEEKLLKKINEKDKQQETKVQHLLKQERQKAWLSIFSLQMRINAFKNTVVVFRSQKMWAKTNSKLKKAIRILQK